MARLPSGGSRRRGQAPTAGRPTEAAQLLMASFETREPDFELERGLQQFGSHRPRIADNSRAVSRVRSRSCSPSNLVFTSRLKTLGDVFLAASLRGMPASQFATETVCSAGWSEQR